MRVRSGRRVRGVDPGGRRGGAPAGGPRWIVTLPAWGDRCVGVLCRHTLPALLTALTAVDRPKTLLVWTDQPERVLEALRPRIDVLGPGVEVTINPVPGPDNAFESMSNCHRHALAVAQPHDRVLLLTSDMVVSREVVATCEAKLAAGARIVCCAAMRTSQEGADRLTTELAGVDGRTLLEWAWENRHRMTRECTWPEGTSYDVWRMYFARDDEVAARVFLPHPLAVMPGGKTNLDFRPTIDVNLTSHFSRAVTYMITQPEEGAAIELSPDDKEFLITEPMRVRFETRGPSCPPFIPTPNARHRMFFEKKVVIRGTGGDCGDGEVVGRVLG